MNVNLRLWLALPLALCACPSSEPEPSSQPPPIPAERSAPPRLGLQGLPDALATVDGQPISVDRLSNEARMEIFRRQVDVHGLLIRERDRLIDEFLLEREAKRRKLTVEALLAAEVDAKLSAPTDAEVDRTLAEQGGPESARPRVVLYLTERARLDRKLTFTKALRARAEVTDHIPEPKPPRLELDLEGAPIRGPLDAKVTIVEFLDWRSTLSSSCAKNVAKLAEHFGDRVRVAHRTVLQPGDEWALSATILAERALEKGQFWRVHDALLLKDYRPLQEKLPDLARELGVDPVDLETGRHDPQTLLRMRNVAKRARRAGVLHPPVLFINGRRLGGTFGYKRLFAEVHAELHLLNGTR